MALVGKDTKQPDEVLDWDVDFGDWMRQIFYPMFTGRAEGTGLGLSIAQALINQHNGLIECDSEPGNTVFSIFLPMEAGND